MEPLADPLDHLARVFVASLDLFIVNIAFPEIARDFAGSSLADSPGS